MFTHPAVKLAKAVKFSEFLNNTETQRSIEQAHYASYVTDNKGVTRCNLFASIEHLHNDLAPFEAHLGFELTPIERVNTSPRKADYRGYFTRDDVEIVARICAGDIERFGYRF